MSAVAVTPRERDLLLVARALVGEVPREEVLELLGEPRHAPQKLGPNAARLLRETLAAGVVHALMRRGGARASASIEGGRVVRGRTWERTPPLALHFSALTVHLLRWLLETPLAQASPPLLGGSATIADELVLYLARDLLAPDLAASLAAQPVAQTSPLLRLAFPRDPGSTPAFEPWLRGGGAVVVAALAPDLAATWIELPFVGDRVGSTDAVASAFLAACDAMDRRDLAQLFLDAGAAILGRRGETTSEVAARIAPHDASLSTVAARAARRAEAGAPLRAMRRVARWHEEHRLVRHFDDEYPVAQHLVARWEGAARLFPLAEGVLRELDRLDGALVSVSRSEVA